MSSSTKNTANPPTRACRGFVFPIDASFALLIFATTLLIISGQVFQDPVPKTAYLRQATSDTLTVLEKSGKLGKMLGENTTQVRQVLESLPPSLCVQIALTPASGVPTVLSKPGCDNYGNDIVSIRRGYVYNNSYYVAQMKGWLG